MRVRSSCLLLIAMIFASLAEECVAQTGMLFNVSMDMRQNPLVKQAHAEAGVNAADKAGNTPLMLAAKKGDGDVVKYLLEHGTDLSLKNSAGDTARDIAQKSGKPAILQQIDEFLKQYPAADDYYAANAGATLATDCAQNQSGSPGLWLEGPLVVSVLDASGKPLPGAPVKFSVPPDEGQLMASSSSAASAMLVLRTDEQGKVSVFFRLPNKPSFLCHITVTTGTTKNASELNFTALTNDGTRPGVPSAFIVSRIGAEDDGDQGVEVAWESHYCDPEYTIFQIGYCLPGKPWRIIYNLPGDYTRIHVPPDFEKKKLPLPVPTDTRGLVE